MEIHDKNENGHDALSLYLREIGATDLLTPQNEVRIAGLVKKGDKGARETMIKANLRLVVKIAREYDGLGMPLLDLINEGNLGLMKAVERFDPAKGAKFSTYSSWWIKQSIRRALASQGKTIRLPTHVADKIYNLYLVENRLQGTLGRKPTEEELAQELGTTSERVAKLRVASFRPVSLDMKIGDDDDCGCLGDVIPDEGAANPSDQMEHSTTLEIVGGFFEKLNSVERRILQRRFGLNGESEQTFGEIGKEFGLTGERVRQIQNFALRKLRQMLDGELPQDPVLRSSPKTPCLPRQSRLRLIIGDANLVNGSHHYRQDTRPASHSWDVADYNKVILDLLVRKDVKHSNGSPYLTLRRVIHPRSTAGYNMEIATLLTKRCFTR